MKRRDFVKISGASAMGAAALSVNLPIRAFASTQRPTLQIKKSLKYSMVQEKMPIVDQFKMLRDIGYDGVEMDSPSDINIDDVLEAKEKSGLQIPGVINSMHWKAPLSDPDPEVRNRCRKATEQALRDCKAYGGTTVLLVPGVVNDKISYQEAYQRSQEEIKKVLPVVEETGVRIAFENVWNNFLLSPLEAARYVDQFDHPLIGWYFDVGNVVRYGWPEHWIEALGDRIFKLDIKEYSRRKQTDEGIWKGFDVELLEGDCNWPKVNNALEKIRYSGWASAEVKGGGKERLAFISQKMDAIFGIT
jgi:L-ribulose-5-phosphate 3-epimerase